MRITATKCETAAGFALPAAGHGPAPLSIEKCAEAPFSLARVRAKGASSQTSRFSLSTPCQRGARRAGVLFSAFVLAACAPTIHLDAPTMPTVEMPPATARCAKEPVKTLAPLDPPPQLPDARQSPCPLRSGLAACFTLDQDIMRQQRFKILHDDRDYCRDAYHRAITRGDGEAAK